MSAMERGYNLFDSLQTPTKGNESDDRIEIKRQLCEGTACTSKDSNETVHAGHLVQQLQAVRQVKSRVMVVQRTVRQRLRLF